MKMQWSAVMLTGLTLLIGGRVFALETSNSQAPLLGDLRSFEVHEFEAQNFSSDREKVPPEIVEYVRTAIQNDERFTYRSPGEGIVRLYCDSPLCGRIRMEITQGQDGPVVWKASRQFRPVVTLVEPNARKFAKNLVSDLAAEYEKAIKENPATIPIKE